MKHSTIDVLKQQIEDKRENERRQREAEILQYNEHLDRSVSLILLFLALKTKLINFYISRRNSKR